MKQYAEIQADGCTVLVHYDEHVRRWYASAPGWGGVSYGPRTRVFLDAAVRDALCAWRNNGKPASAFTTAPPHWVLVSADELCTEEARHA